MWRLLWLPLQAYLGVALGRLRPQDLPASHALFVLTYVAYCAATVLLTAMTEALDVAMRAMLVDALVLPSFTLAALWLRSCHDRWLQTLTALSGVGALFTLLALPPFAIISLLPETPPSGLASIVVLALFAWNVLALGHILRHALSLPLPAGVLVAMAYVAVNTAAVGFVVPEVAT